MRTTLAATCLLATAAQAAAVTQEDIFQAVHQISNIRRALPNSPNGYAPSFVDCPSNPPTVRSARTVSPNETAWLEQRRRNVVQPMRDLLSRVNINGFDAGAYVDQHADNSTALPNIGLAFSGGGYRALMNGAGALAAFDNRTPGATDQGHIGGLLQASTYIAGLSGGAWLVGSIYTNNFTTVLASRDQPDGSLWEFGNSILEGPAEGGIQIFNTAQYYADIASTIQGKRDAGFNASLTDIWSRALSYQLINASAGGPAYTWSSIALLEDFQSANQPFPIAIADARAPGQMIISLNSSVFEFNPFEMGTWDASTFGFVPTRYLGTNMTAGEVTQGAQCVVGFDNAAFVMGTSSSLFNQVLLQIGGQQIPGPIRDIVTSIFTDISEDNDDIADYEPNPFFGWNPDTNRNANADSLTLVDGGSDNQNLPLHPLIQPVRNVDVIVAVDSSADTNNWPNASALVQTFERSQNAISNGTGFPYIPDTNTIINLGLNTHPTFFGCDSNNVTQSSTNAVGVPLVIYIPNSPYVTYSNLSTAQYETNDTQRNAVIQNGYNVATMGNGTVDSEWPVCLACALLSRSLERTGTQVPQACQSCFDRYCWNGTLASQTPPSYEPTLRLQAVKIDSGASMLGARLESMVAVGVAGVVAAAFLL